MPKQTPTIPNEILWARLGDRSALSDELLIFASQAGPLLGRSPDQLAEDRKVGNPPPFKKIGGSVYYRLGTVRDLIFNSPEFNNTTQARQAANKNRLGIHSNFLVWQAYAEDDDLWPFLIGDGERPIEFSGVSDAW